MVKIGLVLSGGAFKGLAHVGVLKVLKENNIKVDAVAGCSMGAIIGAFYAAGRTPQEIEDFVVKQNFRSVLNFSIKSFSKLGIQNLSKMKKLIEDFTGVKRFSELKIPLYINATNITKEKEVVFSRGELFRAIRASISIPGIFAPVKIKNDYYVDGGVLNNTPVSILPNNIKKYIISDAVSYEKLDTKKGMGIKDIVEKSILLMMHKITETNLKNIPKKDYVLVKPKLSKEYTLPKEAKFRQIIKEGEIATWRKILEIKRKIHGN